LERTQFRFVDTWHPDAPLWSAGPWVSAVLRIAFGRRRTMGIVHVHLSFRGSFVREGSLMLLARARHMPVVATIHSGAFPQFSARHPRLVRRVLAQADV